MADTGEPSPSPPPSATGPNLRQRYPQPDRSSTTAPPPAPPPPPRVQRAQQNARERAVAGAVGLGLVTAAVGGTYLLVDNEAFLPVAAVACFFTFSTVLFKFAFGGNTPGNGRPRVRHIRHHRHLTGERAAYVRTSQRLAMMDRDFTDADYDMLLDLDNNSQRLRRFLEGASQETVSRLPTFFYRDPTKRASDNQDNEKPADALPQETQGENSTAGIPDVSEDVDTDAVDDLKAGKLEQAGIASTAEADAKIRNITANDSEFAGDTAKVCTICLEHFEDGMKIRILPCFHRFMADCIDPWLAQQARCPVCKHNIQEVMNSMPPGMS